MFCEVLIVGECETYIEGNPKPRPLLFFQIVCHSSLYFEISLSAIFNPVVLATGLIRVKTQNSKSAGGYGNAKFSGFSSLRIIYR
jgi:hypothetical protein